MQITEAIIILKEGIGRIVLDKRAYKLRNLMHANEEIIFFFNQISIRVYIMKESTSNYSISKIISIAKKSELEIPYKR